MDTLNQVLKNEELIESFDVKAYKEKKNYAVYGALAALEVTNEVQKCYFEEGATEDKSKLLMNLYGLLQSLFVSIDALYQLSYKITNSKKFININMDPNLRELKHIRNDVVGHPANRNTRYNYNAYCILDKNSLTKDSFSYHIYSDFNVKEKKVNLLNIVNAYYTETNKILKTLLNATDKENLHVLVLAEEALKLFPKPIYLEKLENLYKEYLDRYPNAERKQHRFIWRYDLIKQLLDYDVSYSDMLIELKEDVIYLELQKIYTLITDKSNYYSFNHKYGLLYKALNRFFIKNSDLNNYKKYLLDFSSPYFNDIFNEVKNRVRVTDHLYVYVKLVEKLIEENNSDLIYAFMLVIK